MYVRVSLEFCHVEAVEGLLDLCYSPCPPCAFKRKYFGIKTQLLFSIDLWCTAGIMTYTRDIMLVHIRDLVR